MYSRKFNGIGVLPPDYSGVALRQDTKSASIHHPRKDPDPVPCHPRRPVFEYDSFDEPPETEDQTCTANDTESEVSSKNQKEDECPHHGEEPKAAHREISGRSFSLEDIMLAGLLLLLMNDENTDNSLLIIVGLLLLVGM